MRKNTAEKVYLAARDRTPEPILPEMICATQHASAEDAVAVPARLPWVRTSETLPTHTARDMAHGAHAVPSDDDRRSKGADDQQSGTAQLGTIFDQGFHGSPGRSPKRRFSSRAGRAVPSGNQGAGAHWSDATETTQGTGPGAMETSMPSSRINGLGTLVGAGCRSPAFSTWRPRRALRSAPDVGVARTKRQRFVPGCQHGRRRAAKARELAAFPAQNTPCRPAQTNGPRPRQRWLGEGR